MIWQHFARQPVLNSYQRLQHQADKAGTWDEWRERAIAHTRHFCDKSQKTNIFGRPQETDYSLLVEIFLWEGDAEQAWQVAQEGGCASRLWMKLAATREANHPEDALAIYQPAIEPKVNQKDNAAYAEAVDLLLKVRDLMMRLDQQSEFEALVDQLNTTHKRKRNFTGLLKKRGLI